MYVCKWSDNAVLYHNVVVHTFKCKIPLYEMHISRLNILGAMDSTDIVRSSPLLHNNSKLHNILLLYLNSVRIKFINRINL